jgi:hypothetical protein
MNMMKMNYWIDGACGFNCMVRILETLGYAVKQIPLDKNWHSKILLIDKQTT